MLAVTNGRKKVENFESVGSGVPPSREVQERRMGWRNYLRFALTLIKELKNLFLKKRKNGKKIYLVRSAQIKMVQRNHSKKHLSIGSRVKLWFFLKVFKQSYHSKITLIQ